MTTSDCMPLCWKNGDILPSASISTSMVDLAYSSNRIGFAVDMLCYATLPVFWEDNLTEIQNNVNWFGLDFSSFLCENGEVLADAIRRLHIRNKVYKWSICRLIIERVSSRSDSSFSLLIFPIEKAFNREQVFWQICVLAGFRKTDNPVFQVQTLRSAFETLGMTEVFARGCHEGVVLGARSELLETCKGNLFVVIGNKVYTPAQSTGMRTLPGRNWVIDVLTTLNMLVIEEPNLQVSLLYKAEEIFVLAFDGLYAVKGLDTARYYDTLRPKILEYMARMINPEKQ